MIHEVQYVVSSRQESFLQHPSSGTQWHLAKRLVLAVQKGTAKPRQKEPRVKESRTNTLMIFSHAGIVLLGIRLSLQGTLACSLENVNNLEFFLAGFCCIGAHLHHLPANA